MRTDARSRWSRRLVTIPGSLVALPLVTFALPALVALALIADLLRPVGRRTLVSVRLVLFLDVFLFVEVFGLALLAGVWLVTLGSPSRRASLTWPVQRLYTGLLMSAVRVLFSLRFETEGAELAAEGGPVLALVRHASLVDVLIPSVFLANRHRIELRYVLKRELLVDPCIDVAGHFLPNCFVARDGADSEREIEAVRVLKAGIGATSGVLLYPEGTRFTEKKRQRALDRLRSDPEALARAERLRNVLPVRPGGSLTLLSAEPACDVLFVGHHGLEGTASVADIWTGALVGRAIRVKFWRERAASIPVGREAQLAWLAERWQRLDDWLTDLASEGSVATDRIAPE